MRWAVSFPNFGEFADPGLMVDLARLTETSGWDAFFVWDHIVVEDRLPVGDPWAQLAAVATATDRVLIGPMVTPLPRRRPWVVARQSTTIDHLSGGRLVLGVGIGSPPEPEFATFGEPTDARRRADMLDEGLAVMLGMWNGAPFGFAGAHYTVAETTFAPAPLQQPRIPIWVGGAWPNRAPLRRASGFEGFFPVRMDMSEWTPAEVADLVQRVDHHGRTADDFDIAIGGSFEAGCSLGAAYADAGATWFVAGPAPGEPIEELRRKIGSGPR